MALNDIGPYRHRLAGRSLHQPAEDTLPLLISAPAATSASASATSEVSFLHRPCFVDGEVTSTNVFAIELRDCFIRSGVVGHLHKTETFRASGIAICDDLNRFNLTNLTEQVSKVTFRRLKREISNVDFFCHPCSIRVNVTHPITQSIFPDRKLSLKTPLASIRAVIVFHTVLKQGGSLEYFSMAQGRPAMVSGRSLQEVPHAHFVRP
jgi:hypothetical protein